MNLDTLPEQATLRCIPREHDFKVKFIDDGFAGDELYLVGHEFGPTHVVRARSMDRAWSAWIDESPTIDPDDVHEAYGAYDKLCEWLEERGHENTMRMRRFANKWAKWFFETSTRDANYTGAWGEWELIEGYEYQDNASGTGIVNVGHYAWISEYVAEEEIYKLIVDCAQ